MNLASSFAAVASERADHPVVFFGQATLSYAALAAQSRRLAWHLVREFNVQPGDRVAVWLKNRPEFVAAVYAILHAGAAVVPLNNFLKPQELEFILQDAGVTLILSEESMGPGLAVLQTAKADLRAWSVEALDRLPEPPAAFESEWTGSRLRGPNDLAVIIYTSGTTGRPKGAMLSHGNLLANVESCRQVLRAVAMDRFVVLLPMFHSFMLSVGVFLPTLVGGSLVVIKSLNPPKNILAEIFQHQATILPAIPQFFRTLANIPLTPNFPLRLCISGGAPLPVEILREFNAKMPIPLIEGYGLSEASPVVSLNPIHGTVKEGSIGLPIPNVEISIQSDDGTPLPAGQIGELCVRGPNVMLGYWNQPEATADTLRQGWLRTGDIGYLDDQGYAFITDRKKDMLLINGINVYPREIEELMYQFPGVKEAAVVGMPDAKKGELPVAFLAASEGVDLDTKALAQFIRDRLADYKVPRQFHLLPTLPRNATGKILKTALRQQLASFSKSLTS